MKSIPELEELFAQYSEENVAFIERGDSKSANKVMNKLFTVIRQLKSMGPLGFESLRKLMKNNKPSIAVNAAGALREEYPKEAKEVLMKVANDKYGIPSSTANVALLIWEHEDSKKK